MHIRILSISQFVLVILTLRYVPAVQSQTINPYERLVDPLAIARLDNPDFGPLRMSWGIGYAYGADTANPGYYVFAQDTGAGIISHLFVTAWTPDSETNFKLFVDDKLIRDASMQRFFDTSDGFLCSPLDTIICLARLCDVQIPYRHGFKLSYKTPEWFTWYDYAWRPLPSTADLPSGEDLNSPVLIQDESEAEDVYRDPAHLWNGYRGTDTNFSVTIGPDTDTTALKLFGSDVVRSFWLQPGFYNSALDSIWLEIYWDGAPSPAVSTPLLALFGQSFDFRDLHSIPIDFNKDSGFLMRFPMPFANSMRIAFRNTSSRAITVHGRITYFPYSVARSQFGYLHAQFNSINPTQYGVPHHVLHVKGRGRYVGLLMGIPGLRAVQVYEGDPQFLVDSNGLYSYDYDGTEDYFNGAQYFACGNFDMPFGGTSNALANYYRFHYLDALDFRTSFDFDFQHGVNDNAHENYRTLPFWYQQNIRYWTDRDTIRPGERWSVSGAAYQPGEEIHVMLDSFPIADVFASSLGVFSATPDFSSVPFGFHHLEINGEFWPEPILVSRIPTIQFRNEPAPIHLQTGDTLRFGGEGYLIGDSLQVSLGNTVVTDAYMIDSMDRISGWAVMPNVPDGDYHLSIQSKSSAFIISDETIHLTRTLTFECENLWDTSSSPVGTSRYLNLEYLLDYDWWSQSAVLYFSPDSIAPRVNLRFFIPYADTFNSLLTVATGKEFGQYDVNIDGRDLAHFDGYSSTEQNEIDSLSLGEIYFEQGYHLISFQYTGLNPLATDSELWADYVRLTPNHQPALNSEVRAESEALILYPNPASNELIFRTTERHTGDIFVIILSETGRTVWSKNVSLNGGDFYSIPVNTLPSGTYWLRVQTSVGSSNAEFHVLH